MPSGIKSVPEIKCVKEKIEFVNLTITGKFCLSESAAFKTLSSGCAEAVLGKLSVCDALGTKDATEILTYLHESHLLKDDKEKIANAINTKVIAAQYPKAIRDKKARATQGEGNATHTQTINVENYLKQDAWNFILSTRCASSRIAFLGDVCRGLGVFNPSENTAAGVASLAFIGLHIRPSDVSHVRDLKNLLKDKKQNYFFTKGPDVYPDNPEELKETHPVIWEMMYKDEAPAKCPVDPETLHSMKENMPRRCSRAGSCISSVKRSKRMCLHSSQRDAFSLVAGVLQQQRLPNHLPPRLRILGDNQQQGTTHTRDNLPAIEDGKTRVDMPPPPPNPRIQNDKNAIGTKDGVGAMICQMKTQLSKKNSVADADGTESEDGNSSDGKMVGVESVAPKEKKKRPASARLARSDTKKTKHASARLARSDTKKTKAKYEVTPEHMLPMALRGFKKTKAQKNAENVRKDIYIYI